MVEVPSISERLAEHLRRPVGAAARDAAGLRVLDWCGCVGGALADPFAADLARALGFDRWGRAPVVATAAAATAVGRSAVGVADALYWNAALGNVLEMDDVERRAILHPGPIVVPVALALGETIGADARAVLDAIVRGYEATIRIGAALGTAHYRYWHSTATAGSFGAAAAAGSLLGLDRDALADALGTAGSTTGGLWQVRHEDAPTKAIHSAESATRGLTAARLAAAGIRGPRRILEGPHGLFAATAPDSDATRALADLDRPWLISATSIKPWAACRHVHPAIDALRAVWHSGDDWREVQSVRIATYAEALAFCDRPHPVTTRDAKFSLQHAIAAVLVEPSPSMSRFTAARVGEPPLPALRARVAIVEDPAISTRFPEHYGARVELLLADGTRRVGEVRDAWGDPEWPLTPEELSNKARSLLAWGGIEPVRAAHIVDAALGLAGGGALSTLTQALAEAR